MPVVPGDPFVPSVMPQGQMVTNTINRATPDAFGGQAGQTLQQTGNMLEQHAVARQQLANETSVNDVYVNQFSPAARTIYQNYMTLEGKDAEAQFSDFQQQMNDLRTQIRSGLPNMMQQKAFDEASTRRVEADLDGMARHGAAQTKAWEWNTHTAVMADLVNEGEANWNNPQRLQDVRDRMDNETANYGLSHGWSGDVFRNQLHQNNDSLWSAVIKRQALADPAGAMRTYQDKVLAGRISGRAQGELDSFFKPVQDLQSAQNAYGKVTGGAMAGAISAEAQRQGVDPGTALTIWSAEGGHSLRCVSPLCAGPSQNASSPRPISCEGGVTNPDTKNPTSQATGIFQFMPGTWPDMGGTDQDRLDAKRQVELGVALTKQNNAALAKDLGREPQTWEVYLAHQQGIGGAKALLHADPNANAGDVVGNPKAITGNAGTTEMTAEQFINTIKGYVDRHSQMYAPNGTPTAQNLSENYEAGLQAVTDLARQEYPGDPTPEARYRSHFIQQAGQQIHAEQVTDKANGAVVSNSLTGPNPVSSWQEFNCDPKRKAAIDALYKTDNSIYDKVDRAININAWKAWDPPATDKTNQLYDSLNGMQFTDKDRFSNLNLMQYYGGMPVSQFKDLVDTQKKIHDNDATQAAKQTNLNASLVAVKGLTGLAAATAESPYFRMDGASPLLPEQQQWNVFVSKFGQGIEDWRHNNNGKILSALQEREIAQQTLFPQGGPARDAQPGAAAGTFNEGRQRDATPGPASELPEAGAITNPPTQDINTGKDANADINVLESNGKPDQRRITEVLPFDPVGHLRSSFGHTAININGTTYAFTEKGWNKGEVTAKYLANNDFRNAVGQELDLTPEEQDLLLKVIHEDIDDNPKWSSQNSCVTKIRDALEQATGRMFGIPPRPLITGPLDFRDNLDRFGYVVKKNWYPRTRSNWPFELESNPTP